MRALLRDELVAALVAAGVVALVEAVALAGGVWLSLTALLLLGLIGLAVGGAMALSEWVIARYRLAGIAAALVRVLPSLAATVPVAATLFEGGHAATLPGAGTGHLWLPPVALLTLAAVVWLGARLVASRGRPLVAGALVLLVVGVELANRSLYPSLYPRVHTLLVIASVAALAVALRLLGRGEPPAGLRSRRLLPALGALLALSWLVPVGLADADDRWQVATHGTHTRHVANLVRALVDFDRDGYAAILGGGDCDDLDADRNPGARDRPDNGVDEDCDGVDAEPVKQVALDPAVALTLEEHRDSPAARALRTRMQSANLLMISVDALRADALAPTDANRREFPRLSELVAGSRSFRNAVSPSAGTDVSLASMITGRVDPFVPVATTLMEALAASGRRTHALWPSEVLRWAPRTLLTRGLAGHDKVVTDSRRENIGDRITAPETTDRAIALLDSLAPGQRFALWAHYFDVHEHKQIDAGNPELVAVGRDLATTEGKYRALLTIIDTAVGRLLDEIDARGLTDSTVVVLFSDHGESLGEDQRLPDNHGLYVYGALTAIPLAVVIPGIPPATIDEPVSLLDLYPTLVELFGLAAGEADGVSLFLHLLPAPPPGPHHPGRVIVLNESKQWGLIEWPYKLMVRPGDNLTELYDLARDPGEQNNLADGDGARVRRLKQLYDQFPEVSFDRSRKGRAWRERQARPPPRR